jgi:hypothetical protein
MLRRLLLALPVCLAAVSVCAAGIGTGRFTISIEAGHDSGFLAVRRGELTVGDSTFGSVFYNEDAADRWYISGPQIKSSVGGGYLAYDPTGKSNRVLLRPKPGEGTDWVLGVSGRARRGKRGAIQAASGPLKGWYLDVASGEDKQETAEGKKAARPALVLSKHPSRKLEAEQIWDRD